MKRLLTLVAVVAAGLWLAMARPDAPVRAQEVNENTFNPDISLPPQRVDANANLGVREARQRIYEAMQLQDQGKPELALDKWRDAWGRYDSLRQKYLQADRPPSGEMLVKDDQPSAGANLDGMHTEKWATLADHINAAFRTFDWPKDLHKRWTMRNEAPGAELLQAALEHDDYAMLRRCARFYQFSAAGRKALGLLAQRAAESGDALNARRWLEELQGAWPEDFDRDPMLNLMLIRVYRELDARLPLDAALRRIERTGLTGTVDVGGKRKPLKEQIEALVNGAAPAERPELGPSGWRTMQGAFDRNAVAPPVTEIADVVRLGPDEKTLGYKVGKEQVKPEANNDPYGYYQQEESVAPPIIFPSTHAQGFFLHKPQVSGQEGVEQLLWFQHGREQNPIQLEVPKNRRYSAPPANRGFRGGWGWGARQGANASEKCRILASTIATVRWPLDQRESDVLFAVMGLSRPAPDRPAEPTGNQVQSFDVTSDMALRGTFPNKKLENEQDWAFLQHVTFMGAPVVVDNKLYISGAIPAASSIEYWVLCFDVTPKGDPAAGEGKLLWRTHCCSLANKGNDYYRPQTVTPTDTSSLAMQGGTLYLCTQTGGIAGVDRLSGELNWVSCYRRPIGGATGWFNNAPIAACGNLLAAPHDSVASTSSELALVLDGGGVLAFEQPRRGKGAKGEYRFTLGIVDNSMVIQGRKRLYRIALSSFRRDGKVVETDWAELVYQTADFSGGTEPIGRGLIAGERVLVPMRDRIVIYNVRSGKLMSEYPFKGLSIDASPVTLTVYCRGETYKDEDQVVRYRPATVSDPATGNIFNVEHLPNGAEFTFPSGGKATVKKETFVLMASSSWVYLFTAKDR